MLLFYRNPVILAIHGNGIDRAAQTSPQITPDQRQNHASSIPGTDIPLSGLDLAASEKMSGWPGLGYPQAEFNIFHQWHIGKEVAGLVAGTSAKLYLITKTDSKTDGTKTVGPLKEAKMEAIARKNRANRSATYLGMLIQEFQKMNKCSGAYQSIRMYHDQNITTGARCAKGDLPTPAAALIPWAMAMNNDSAGCPGFFYRIVSRTSIHDDDFLYNGFRETSGGTAAHVSGLILYRDNDTDRMNKIELGYK